MFKEALRPGALLLLLAGVAFAVKAEEGYMSVLVQSIKRQPIANIRIGTAVEGSIELTDVAGRARLKLAARTIPGARVKLLLVPPPDAVMISPMDGETIVPAFDNAGSQFLQVMLLRPGDKEDLQNGAVLIYMARASQRQLNEQKPAPPAPARPRRTSSLGWPGGFYLVASGRELPQVGSSAELPLITEEVAKQLGFDKQQVDEALKSWNADLLTWKMMTLTAVFESGDLDPFSLAIVEPRDGISFGVGYWTVRRSLLDVLQRMRERDKAAFDEAMGPDADFVASWLQAPVKDAEQMMMERIVGKEQAERSRRLHEPWRSRFAQLGAYPPFQRIQVEFLKPWVLRGDQAARETGLRSERAHAFFYDLVFSLGNARRLLEAYPADRRGFQLAFGRSPDEQESLQLLANRSIALLPGFVRRFEDFMRQRRQVFATGEGMVGGRRISLEEAGIRMRDVETGAPIQLSGDAEVGRRLATGWLPVALQ